MNKLILDLAYRNTGYVIVNSSLDILNYGIISISAKVEKSSLLAEFKKNYRFFKISGIDKKLQKYTILRHLKELELFEILMNTLINEFNISEIICEQMSGAIHAKGMMFSSLIHSYCFHIFRNNNLKLYYIYEKVAKRLIFLNKKKVKKQEVIDKISAIYKNLEWFDKKETLFNHIADALLILEAMRKSDNLLDNLEYRYNNFLYYS